MIKEKILLKLIAQFFHEKSLCLKKKKKAKLAKILIKNKKLQVQFYAILRKYKKFYKLIN
jgi:hypothetical protein